MARYRAIHWEKGILTERWLGVIAGTSAIINFIFCYYVNRDIRQ
jgi:hypothetical protein